MNSVPVRSVVRAVKLLQALNKQAVSSLDVLHAQTGLPKPTIVRLLQTLEFCDVVRHAPQHGAYYLTSEVRSLACGYHSEPMVVEVASSLMDALTLRIKWPMALAVPDDIRMVVRYSTIPLSPLALKHSTVNSELSLVSRAVGRAYLAFCAGDHQGELLRRLALSSADEDKPAKDSAAMRKILDDVRQAGYALRDPLCMPVSNTLAVPVFDAHGVAASLGLTFFSSTLKPQQAVERYLGALQDTAREIGCKLKALQGASQPKAVPATTRAAAALALSA